MGILNPDGMWMFVQGGLSGAGEVSVPAAAAGKSELNFAVFADVDVPFESAVYDSDSGASGVEAGFAPDAFLGRNEVFFRSVCPAVGEFDFDAGVADEEYGGVADGA